MTTPPTPTHGQMVEVAARWLRRTRACSVVITEMTSTLSEIPDAIGWRVAQHWSILVECKISRGDFRRDADKPHRGILSDQSVGQERYYLAPKGVLKAADMPPGWGLIEWDGKRVSYLVKLEEYAVPRDHARAAAEVPLLCSALRREQGGGINGVVQGLGKLNRDDLKIARKVLERRERVLVGLPDEADLDALEGSPS